MSYGDPFRILITGSRDWPRPDIVEEAIIDLHNWHPFSWDDVVIVHGDCPTGADAQAQKFAEGVDLVTERHPADWKKHGKFAGPKRNKEMVDAGADVVLAFPMGESRGTRGCMKIAEEAGLPVKDYEYKLKEK